MIEFYRFSAVWGVVLTLAAFAAGTFLHKKVWKAWCNPILIGAVLVMLVITVLDIPYANYKASTVSLTYLLFPATVSLAIPLCEQWDLLKQHLPAIIAGIAAGIITSIGCIVLLSQVFRLDATVTASLLPKSVTTAIGVDIATELGGISSLTTAAIILSGIVGNLLAPYLCKLLHILNPIAKGIAIGTSSHAIGTSRALEIGQIEGAVSSLSIAIAGILTAILCPLLGKFLPS